MNVGTALLIVGLILTLAGVLGVAYAVFRSSAIDRTLQVYREENAVLGQRADRLEREVAQEREKRVGLEATLAALKDTVTGESRITALGEVIAREEAARRDEHRQQMDCLQKIMAELGPSR